jgi:DNA-directed RNA polymerase subunit RPC12/RpoP
MTIPSIDVSGWQPPTGYQQLPSPVEGITVYAPRPEAPKEEKPSTYTCPNCGATTRYDVSAGGVACEYCGYSVQVKSENVGVAAAESEFTLDAINKYKKGFGVQRKVLHCNNCGAEILVEENALSTTCPFCASNQVNIQADLQDQICPQFLIPFKVKLQDTQDLAKSWLTKGWYHPKELATMSAIDKFRGIYLPFWTFSSAISSKWQAEVGHERQESYYDISDKTWKTRTVIDWRWQNGLVNIKIENLVIPASSHVSHIILERVNPFDMNGLTTYSPDYLAGWQAHNFDITLPVAWDEGKNQMREQARKACYEDINSPHVRNFSMAADFIDEAWRYVLLPVYLTAYRFNEKLFQVMINGQTGTLAGQKPVEWWKIWLAIAALISPGVILGFIGLILLVVGGIGIIPLIVGFILLIIGGIISVSLYRQAVASEAA